jgi:hypothetical protein
VRWATASAAAERGVWTGAVGFGQWSGRTCLYGAGTTSGTPGGDGALTSGPGTESGDRQVGPRGRFNSELKTLLNEYSSKIARG